MPQVEAETNIHPEDPHDAASRAAAARNRVRVRLFAILFALTATFSLSYNFLRAPVYISHATLQIAPPLLEITADNADPARVAAAQRQILTTGPILGVLLERLTDSGAQGQPSAQNVAGLLSTVSVHQIEETDLLELRAEGPDPAFLPVLLNGWIEVYLSSLASKQEAETALADLEQERQRAELTRRVDEKRKELDWFQRQNDIVAMEREESHVLARLKDLTATLNDASAAEVIAKARLDAMQAAIAAGELVARDKEADVILDLDRRAFELREQLQELEQKYTPQYIALDPDIKVMVRQLELVEKQLAEEQKSAGLAALADATRTYDAAHQSAASLRSQLADYRKIATDFTARLAEHQTLRDELALLEGQLRTVQARPLQSPANPSVRHLRFEVVEPAFEPLAPARPRYWRDAGISVAGSLVFAVLAVLLFEFLNRPAR
ncbi:MAG: GumC family protein [Sphingomonadales bacterium]